MKRIVTLLAVALLAPIAAAAGEIATRLHIEGMHCAPSQGRRGRF